MRVPHWASPFVQQTIKFSALPPPLNAKIKTVPIYQSIEILTDVYCASEMNTVTEGINLRGAAFGLAMIKVFGLQKKQEIFKIASNFGKVLFKADSKVALNYIKFDNTIRCIEFPDDMEFDMGDGDKARCCYIAAWNPPEQIETHAGEVYARCIDILSPLYQGDIPMRQDWLRILIKDGESILEATERGISRTDALNPTGFTRDFVQFILKCLLYIHSGDPDLREFKPEAKPRNAKAIKKWRKENICPIPLTLVGFDYKKDRVYTTDETFVDTHLRWQPYGPNRSQVKLIWVKEHIRHYNDQ